MAVLSAVHVGQGTQFFHTWRIIKLFDSLRLKEIISYQ